LCMDSNPPRQVSQSAYLRDRLAEGIDIRMIGIEREAIKCQ